MMTNYAINPVDPIYRMLFEERSSKKDQPSDGLPDIPHTVRASFRGRPNKELKLADPREVFKKLKITKSFPGETLFHSIESFLNAAKQHPVISQSYGDVKRADENGRQGVIVDLNKLDEKNGARYMRILLIYALKLGALRNGKDLRIQHADNKLMIYHTRGGVRKPNSEPKI